MFQTFGIVPSYILAHGVRRQGMPDKEKSWNTLVPTLTYAKPLERLLCMSSEANETNSVYHPWWCSWPLSRQGQMKDPKLAPCYDESLEVLLQGKSFSSPDPISIPSGLILLWVELDGEKGSYGSNVDNMHSSPFFGEVFKGSLKWIKYYGSSSKQGLRLVNVQLKTTDV